MVGENIEFEGITNPVITVLRITVSEYGRKHVSNQLFRFLNCTQNTDGDFLNCHLFYYNSMYLTNKNLMSKMPFKCFFILENVRNFVDTSY